MPAAEHPFERPMAGPEGKSEGLRERKKRETRLLISNIATRLFMERGFDHVTIDDVAAAANVSKMTVFNYFSRKEELFFDRGDDVSQLLRAALVDRGRRSPLATLRALAHDLIEQRHPLVKINPDVASFWKVVADSPALRASSRELAEGLERELAQMLASSVGASAKDPPARLIAALLLGAWRVAFREALRSQRSARSGSTDKVFLELLDRGFSAARAAARGTPYA
jgi:AcrR family transcriptional regulator